MSPAGSSEMVGDSDQVIYQRVFFGVFLGLPFEVLLREVVIGDIGGDVEVFHWEIDHTKH